VPEHKTRGPHRTPRLVSPLLYHLSYLAGLRGGTTERVEWYGGECSARSACSIEFGFPNTAWSSRTGLRSSKDPSSKKR